MFSLENVASIEVVYYGKCLRYGPAKILRSGFSVEYLIYPVCFKHGFNNCIWGKDEKSPTCRGFTLHKNIATDGWEKKSPFFMTVCTFYLPFPQHILTTFILKNFQLVTSITIRTKRTMLKWNIFCRKGVKKHELGLATSLLSYILTSLSIAVLVNLYLYWDKR